MKKYTTELYFLLALIVGTLALAFFIFKPFVIPLILALVFASVFAPLHKRIVRFVGERNPGTSAFLTTIAVLLVAVIPIGFLATQIVREVMQVYAFLASPQGGDFVTSLQGAALDLKGIVPGATDLSVDIGTYTSRGLNWTLGHLSSFLSNALGLLMGLFIFLVTIYYLFKEGERLKKLAISMSPLQDTYDKEIFSKLELAINSVVKGNLTVALVQGILTSIGFLIFGVPNPALWGAVAAIAALIPGFGTALVIGPAVLFLLITGHTGPGLGLLAWGIVAVGLIDNFLGPKLVERGIRIHPFLILLSIIGGLGVFGPMGFILGPLTLSLLVALLEIYSTVRRKENV